MSFRTTIATLSVFLAFAVGTATYAIDKDQIIDPAAPAQQDDSSDRAMSEVFSGQKSSMGVVVTLLGYVLIVGGLCVAVWYLFRRGVIRKPFAKGEGKLKVAETRMLGNRQFIMVVEYEEQKILLGVGPGKIDYLTTLSSYRSSEFPQIGSAPRQTEGSAE